MAIEGELNGLGGVTCDHDGEGTPTKLELKICRSAAGHYLGYFCPQCGPYSRETGYFNSHQDAERALVALRSENLKPENTRDTLLHEGEVTIEEL